MARKSSGCVVYRINEEKARMEILLVTSNSGKNWVFPKGGVEPDLSSRESAAKEVWEEAGVIGQVGQKLGKYRYMKNDQMQKVTMYAMRYERDAESWPEENLRERRWFSADKAMRKVNEFLKPFIHDVMKMKLNHDMQSVEIDFDELDGGVYVGTNHNVEDSSEEL